MFERMATITRDKGSKGSTMKVVRDSVIVYLVSEWNIEVILSFLQSFQNLSSNVVCLFSFIFCLVANESSQM